MSCRRNGLRKQVTEAKEGPLELGREKGKGHKPGGLGARGRGGERHYWASRRESHCPITILMSIPGLHTPL